MLNAIRMMHVWKLEFFMFLGTDQLISCVCGGGGGGVEE